MARRARMREAGPLALALLLAGIACVPGMARAGEESAGTRAAAYLVQGGGPAVLAMGGAAIGGGEGLQAASWNTAALSGTGPLQMYFAHALVGDGGTQGWASAGGRLRGGATRWALSATFRDEGVILGRDAHDQPTGEVSANALALGVQLARPFGERFALGAGTRVVSEALADERGFGLAFDAGAQARFGLLRVGVSGRDFGGGMRWVGERWRMPASFGAGLALVHAPSGVTLALDGVAPANYYRSIRAGAEWAIRERIALRGGYRTELGAQENEPLTGPTFGLGARAGLAWVDYAVVIAGNGETSHRFALSLRRSGGAPAASVVAPVRAPFGPEPPPVR